MCITGDPKIVRADNLPCIMFVWFHAMVVIIVFFFLQDFVCPTCDGGFIEEITEYVMNMFVMS